MFNLKAPAYSEKTVLKLTVPALLIIILIQLAIPTIKGRPLAPYFDEGSLITWVSFLMLLLMGFLTNQVFLVEKRYLISKSAIIWRIFSLGFLFLAIDEMFQIHERIDHGIQSIFNLENNALFSRIDDLIVLLYGVLILLLIYVFRGALRPYRCVISWLRISFLLGFMMILLDLFSHQEQDLILFFDDGQVRATIFRYLGAVEEIFKVWAELFLLVAIYRCWQIACQHSMKVRRRLLT